MTSRLRVKTGWMGAVLMMLLLRLCCRAQSSGQVLKVSNTRDNTASPTRPENLLNLLFNSNNLTATQTDLLNHLFRNYTKDLLPLCANDTVNVKIGLALRQIIDLNERDQILKSNIWMRLSWKDCRLSWNASQYAGIETFAVNRGRLWVPDIALYENVDYILRGIDEYYFPKIMADGTVNFNFPTVIKSSCPINVRYFPFDKQVCQLMFGSWAHSGTELNVVNKSIEGDLNDFVLNAEWTILRVSVTRHVIYYACCEDPYPDVTFFIHLNRKPLFHLFSLVFPCLLMSSISILGFFLPPESGEKVSIGVTVLLSLAVFLLVVNEVLPPNSDTIPFIGIYFGVCMVMVSVSCAMSVCVLNIHYKGELGCEIPKWLKRLLTSKFGKLFCPANSLKEISSWKPKSVKQVGDTFGSERKAKKAEGQVKETFKIPMSDRPEGLSVISLAPRTDAKMLEAALMHLQNKTNNQKRILEWRLLASMTDKVFMICHSLVFVFITLLLLLQTSQS